MGLHVADYAILVVYFIVLISIGFNEARKIKSSGDYFMPRKFGKLMMTFFAFGAGTHSDQAVSVASKSYSSGMPGIWYQWLWLPVTPFYWLIAPIMRRFRAITASDVFELRYNRSVSMLFAIMGAANMIVALGLMLRGSSEVLSGSTAGAVSADVAIAIMTVLFLTYGAFGGLSAAVFIDFIQGVLIIAFSFMLLPMILGAVGGMSGLRESLAGTGFMTLSNPGIGPFYITVIAINAIVGIVVQPSFMGNAGAGRTELEGQVGLVTGNFLKRFCTIPWALIGVAGVVYFAGKDINPDKVFGMLANDFLSRLMPGLLGIFIAGVMASVMSTCDAIMLSTSALLTENLYRVVRPDKDKLHYVWAGRVNCVIIVALSIWFAYSLKSVPKGLEIFWIIASLMGIAFWLGLFWKRTTTAGAWAATIATVVMLWLTTHTFFINFVHSCPLAQQLRIIVTAEEGKLAFWLPWQMIFYLLAGLIAGIVVSLFTKPVAEEKLERYYALVRTPIRPGEVIEKSCHVPAGTTIPPRRNIFPGTSLEFMVPSKQSVIGFLACWVLVVLIVASVYFLVVGV